MRIQFGSSEVIAGTNTVLSLLSCSRCAVFGTELLNRSAYAEWATSIANAHTIALFTNTVASCSTTSNCIHRCGCFVFVVTNKCFNAYATEFASIVNTVGTVSIKIFTDGATITQSDDAIASYQIRRLEVIATTNGIHGGVVTTQQHLTEATFQTHDGTTIEAAIKATVSRIETSFNIEYGRQTVTQVFLAFQAPTGARQVARHQAYTAPFFSNRKRCSGSSSTNTQLLFSLLHTIASVDNTVQSYGRLCGSSAHSSQSGNSNQRFFHCKFLQG